MVPVYVIVEFVARLVLPFLRPQTAGQGGTMIRIHERRYLELCGTISYCWVFIFQDDLSDAVGYDGLLSFLFFCSRHRASRGF